MILSLCNQATMVGIVALFRYELSLDEEKTNKISVYITGNRRDKEKVGLHIHEQKRRTIPICDTRIWKFITGDITQQWKLLPSEYLWVLQKYLERSTYEYMKRHHCEGR